MCWNLSCTVLWCWKTFESLRLSLKCPRNLQPPAWLFPVFDLVSVKKYNVSKLHTSWNCESSHWRPTTNESKNTDIANRPCQKIPLARFARHHKKSTVYLQVKADRSLMNYHLSKEDKGPSSEEKAVNEYYWSVSTFLFWEKNAMSQGRSHLLVYFSKHIFWWRNSRSNKLFTLLNLWQLEFLTRIWWFCGIVSVRSITNSLFVF